ncbi:MAG: hypothetical protein OHK93_008163 [Ramalina farinacea]|uniref:Uncharacterized protein n=1 Tax=Ramalina farinacea TaxID=258253 RepID=A0AA43QLX1_9LECA|nr:hypothetical protein [Ramalina farinacea]
MPRPRQPKLIHTVPLNAPSGKPTPASLAQKPASRPSPQSSKSGTNASDDTDGLVRRDRRRNKGTDGSADRYLMSGALDLDADVRPTSQHIQVKIPKPGQNTGRKRSQEPPKNASKHVLPTKTAATSQEPSFVPSSQPQDSHEAPNRGALQTIKASNRSNNSSKVHGTPLAQSSFLGGLQFKRRVRQPSLLTLAQPQPDTNNDLEGDDLEGDDLEGDDLEGDESLEDFRPDDESTPMVKSMAQSDELTVSQQETSSSRKRKRPSPDILVPASQSQPQLISSASSSVESDSSLDLLNAQGEDAEEPTLPRLRQTKPASPEIYEETLAPPQSSSSPEKPKEQPKKMSKKSKPPKKKGARAQRDGSESPAPSPRSSTPDPQAAPVRHNKIPVQPLTTARLQNLLPRRRTRAKPADAFDIPSSSDVELDTTHLAEDEDELSFHTAGKRRRKDSRIGTASRAKAGTTKKNTKMLLGGKRPSKTYARQSLVEPGSEDDEIGVEEDSAFQVSGEGHQVLPKFDAKAQAEMERMAKKFKEVDEYALDFEDMTGSNSSQMKDAR